MLVDRVWPRGIRKDALRLDDWVKEVAPSATLRTWYGHRPELFEEFRRRYLVELRDPERAAALQRLRARHREGTVTILTATRDFEHSHAAVISELLRTPG